MTADERNILGQVETLIRRLGRSVKRFKLDADGMLVEGVNGRSVYFKPNGSVMAMLEWKAYENDGTEIPNKASGARMIPGWEAPVKKMLMGLFGGKEARSEELALALVRKGMNMSEAVIVATTACDRCMGVLACECGLDWEREVTAEDRETGCNFCRGRV